MSHCCVPCSDPLTTLQYSSGYMDPQTAVSVSILPPPQTAVSEGLPLTPQTAVSVSILPPPRQQWVRDCHSPPRPGPPPPGTCRSRPERAVAGAATGTGGWSSTAGTWADSQTCTGPGGRCRSWTCASWTLISEQRDNVLVMNTDIWTERQCSSHEHWYLNRETTF